MKKAYEIQHALAFLFFSWPWILGIADLAFWCVTGSQITSIPWEGHRGRVLAIWPVVTVFIFCALS